MKLDTKILTASAFALVAATSLTACSESDSGDNGSECAGGKCDAAGAVADLEGFNDPIAVFLKENMDAEGTIDIEYIDMLVAIAEQQGCDRSSIDSYIISDELVVSDGSGPFPRVVNTVCSTDRTKADLAFFALSFANSAGTDVDTHAVEMFGWDNTTREYRFYKTEHVPGTETRVRVQPEPAECEECHLAPKNVDGVHMPMTPIMNELSAPWEHWFAEPISVNHVVDPDIASAPRFAELAGEGSEFRKSAARLEQTIRTAFTQRVAPARLRARRDQPADVEVAMAMLRPLFCDEQVTYITEDGSSGLLSSTSVVDDGLHSAYFQMMGTGWTWEWWNDRILRINPPGAPDAVNMMPVRGASVVAYEKQLMASRGIKAEVVMQIRALDWSTAAMSDFRCGLWTSALDRVKADPPEITAETRNMHLFDGLLAEILTIVPADHGLSGDLPAEIAIPVSDQTVISLSRADTQSLQTLAEALAAGDDLSMTPCGDVGQGVCQVTFDSFGALIEARFKAIEAGGRDFLNAERNVRACLVQKNFPNQPFIPDVDCAAAPDDTDPGAGDDGAATDDGGMTDDGTTSGPADGGSSGGADVGTCCTANEADAGCSEATIESCVCEQDNFCCSDAWDATCVDNVDAFGCGAC